MTPPVVHDMSAVADLNGSHTPEDYSMEKLTCKHCALGELGGALSCIHDLATFVALLF